ncbi:MAG: hypothetical protein M1831_002960 [Alyxoria varia]|nr:MAG: hypothetical protein M1831_002960 [Alyxoria varia]
MNSASLNSASQRFSRVLSIRDRRQQQTKARPETPDPWGLFALDEKTKKPSKDEEKKITELTNKLATLGNGNVPRSRIDYAIRASSPSASVDEAFQLLMLHEDAVGGVLKPYNPHVKLLGADNRERVTCYLDALLFAMFAKLDTFEAILYKTFDDEPRKRLVTALRLWVNLLRTGRLITTDITQRLQEALVECGWEDAGRLRQQDTSEAFGFITDKLELPLLTLKTDIYHSGKEAATDDHKFITERLLDVAIPDDAPKDVVKLEQCLEEYFNNKVEVRRELMRRNTLQSVHSPRTPVEKANAVHVENAEVDSNSSTPLATEFPKSQPFRPPQAQRHASIFSERKVETQDPPRLRRSSSCREDEVKTPARRRKGSMRREVSIPAWQFLNLIPWYTDNANGGDNQIAAHFSEKRPMLGICLKRYTYTKNGAQTRLSTRIDVPLELMPPYFAVGDEPSYHDISQFKLVLESVVCHRGQHVNSGHYIAFSRAKNSSSSQANHDTFSEADTDAPDIWLRFDDLALNKIVQVTNIEDSLNRESPYLLFYRVTPVDESIEHEQPPPYSAANEPFSTVDQKLANLQPRGRHSLDATERLSERSSLALSDSARGHFIDNQSKRQSAVLTASGDASIKTDPASNAQSTPVEEPNGNQKPSSRPKSGRPSLDFGNEKLMNRISAKFSRDKLTATTNIVPVDSNEDGGPAKSHPQTTEKQLLTEAKPKRKSNIERLKSTRLPGGMKNGPNGKEPERDCSMM